MNKQQAKKFIKQVFKDVWIDFKFDKLSDYYSKDIIAYIGKQTVAYEDIVNRTHFIKEALSENINELEDILYDEQASKITVRLRQTPVYKNKGAEKTYLTNIIYQITNNKISKAWAVFDEPIDYLKPI